MQPNTIQNLPKLTPEQLAQNNAELASGKITASPTALTQGYQTISSDNLLPTKAVTIQPTPYNNPAIGLQTSIEQNNKNILTGLQASQEAQKTAYDTSKSDLQSTINNIIGIQQNRSALETSAGIDTKAKALTDITNEIESKQLALRRTIEDLQSKNPQGLSAQGLDTEVNRINREGTRELADLAIIQSARNRDLSTAQTLVDRKIQLQLEPLKTLLDYQKTVLEDNRDLYTKAEQRTYENTIRQNEQKYNAEQDKLKTLEATKLTYQQIASTLGASSTVMKAIQNAQTPTEVLDIASRNNLISLEDKYKLAQINNTLADAYKKRKEADQLGSNGFITNTKAGDYTGAINTILGSSKLTKDQRQTFIGAINSGQSDIPTIIKNQVKDIMPNPEATLLYKYETARDTLSNLGTLLQQYYDNGGSTNIVKGKLENVASAFGEVNDPKLREIATQIQGNLQIYRNAISGTAYSAQEGKDIQSIFPGINKTQSLNDAILKGRQSLFDSTIDSMYSNTLGKDNWQKIKPVLNTASTQQPVNTQTNQPVINANNRTVTVGGKTYTFSTTEAFNKAIKEAGYSQ